LPSQPRGLLDDFPFLFVSSAIPFHNEELDLAGKNWDSPGAYQDARGLDREEH